MKKNAALIFFFTIITLSVKAQNDSLMETMMTRRVVTCPDIILNATTILPQLYKDGQVQLIQDMLLYWQKNCGDNEPLHTFKTLYQIEHNQFKEDDYSIYHYLLLYLSAVTDVKMYWGFQGSQFADKGYYTFIREWSNDLLHREIQYSSTERFLLAFYAKPSDSLLQKLAGKEFNGTTLQAEQKRENRYKNPTRHFGMAITGGAFTPTGNLAKIGAKATLGLQSFYVKNKWSVNVELVGRISSKGSYVSVLDKDSLFKVNNSSGVYVGLGCNYELVKLKRHGVELQTGMGYEGITFVLVKGEYGAKDYTKDRSSLNVNAGLGYRYYFEKYSPFSYLGLSVRYDYLDYKNKGGSSLSGNAIVIALNVGIGI